MVRVLSHLLLLAVAATAVNAQFADFLKTAFGGIQKPLGSAAPNALVAKISNDLTSENWRRSVNITADLTANEEAAKEWLFYFTTTATNGTALKNVTFWDGVYNDTIRQISTSRSVSKLHFGKADCAAPAAEELCHSFFLNANHKLPSFYHAATYLNNGTTQIRRIPMWRNLTEISEQSAFFAKFHAEKQWKDIEPWTGMFSPIDGSLKDYAPILSSLLQYYEMMPQWLFMILISVMGRGITSRMIGNRTIPPSNPTAAPARRTGPMPGDASR